MDSLYQMPVEANMDQSSKCVGRITNYYTLYFACLLSLPTLYPAIPVVCT